MALNALASFTLDTCFYCGWTVGCPGAKHLVDQDHHCVSDSYDARLLPIRGLSRRYFEQKKEPCFRDAAQEHSTMNFTVLSLVTKES
jgi:hypothetical protein